jgi:hypothetical protein
VLVVVVVVVWSTTMDDGNGRFVRCHFATMRKSGAGLFRFWRALSSKEAKKALFDEMSERGTSERKPQNTTSNNNDDDRRDHQSAS